VIKNKLAQILAAMFKLKLRIYEAPPPLLVCSGARLPWLSSWWFADVPARAEGIEL